MLDRRTFEDIFREHHAACVAFVVHYTGNVHEAEEVVQQVFLRLWEKRETDRYHRRYQVVPVCRPPAILLHQ